MTAVTIKAGTGYRCMCQHCGVEFPTMGANRRYCDKHWLKVNRTIPPDPDAVEHRGEQVPPRPTAAARAANFIEDIEWLFSQGEGVAGICQRLDRNPKAIERRLAKWGRHDLAQIFRRYH